MLLLNILSHLCILISTALYFLWLFALNKYYNLWCMWFLLHLNWFCRLVLNANVICEAPCICAFERLCRNTDYYHHIVQDIEQLLCFVFSWGSNFLLFVWPSCWKRCVKMNKGQQNIKWKAGYVWIELLSLLIWLFQSDQFLCTNGQSCRQQTSN